MEATFYNDRRGKALFAAASKGKIEKMKTLLDNDDQLVNYSVKYPNFTTTAVHVAVKNSQYSALELLIAREADLDIDSRMLLILVCGQPNEQVFELLLKSGMDASQEGEEPDRQISIVWLLVKKQDFNAKMLQLALENGADMTKFNTHDCSVFHEAIEQGNAEALQILLEKISRKDFKKINSYKPMTLDTWYQESQDIITFAIRKGSLAIMRTLLPLIISRRFSYLRACNGSKKLSPTCLLHLVIFRRTMLGNQTEIVKMLLDNGFTHRCCAIRMSDDFKARFQLGQKQCDAVDIIQKCYSNCPVKFSLLGCAILRNEVDIASLLISQGANVNPKSSKLAHPLAIAAAIGNNAMCQLLLSHGANPNYQIAAKYGKLPVVLMATLLGGCSTIFTMLKSGGDLRLLPEKFRREFRTSFGDDVYKWVMLLGKAFLGYSQNIPEDAQVEDIWLEDGQYGDTVCIVDTHAFAMQEDRFLVFGKGLTTLQQICRATINRTVLKVTKHGTYKEHFDKLWYPNPLKRYLKYEDMYNI